jgi:transposase
MYELDILPLRMILECVGFSLSIFYHILDLWVTTGDVVAHNFGLPGCPRLLHFEDVNYLLRLIRHQPDWFLDELSDLLKTNHFISVYYVTIHQELCRAGASLKKLKKIATERKEDFRNEYIECMAQYDANELGFIDETSKNDKTAT